MMIIQFRNIFRMRLVTCKVRRTFYETPFEISAAIFLVVVGFTGLITGTGSSPASVDKILPLWLILAWNVGEFAGGWLVLFGRFGNRRHIEAAGLVLMVYGVSLYALVLVVAANWPGAMTVTGGMVAIGAGSVGRLKVLHAGQQAIREASKRLRKRGD